MYRIKRFSWLYILSQLELLFYANKIFFLKASLRNHKTRNPKAYSLEDFGESFHSLVAMLDPLNALIYKMTAENPLERLDLEGAISEYTSIIEPLIQYTTAHKTKVAAILKTKSRFRIVREKPLSPTIDTQGAPTRKTKSRFRTIQTKTKTPSSPVINVPSAPTSTLIKKSRFRPVQKT